MFGLNIGEGNRIMSATYLEYASADNIIVDVLPEGDITDYLYVDGEYIYDPQPKPKPKPEPEQPIDYETRIAALEEELTATKILLGVT